jgi:hypothetical protein
MNDSTAAPPMSRSPRSDPARTGVAEGAPPIGASAPGRLIGAVRRVADVTPGERGRMHAILARYFANAGRAQFERDLAEKEWTILLADAASGELQGFSTLMRLRTVVAGRSVVAFFSGDTIVERAYWGEAALSRLWAGHVFGLAGRIRRRDPAARVYWFLISSGYKTYRFLPTFFREFYPTCERPTPPDVKRTLDALARLKFGARYDAARGVVRLAHATPLRPGVAEVEAARLRDPHVAFFAAANPGHREGDELACLTEVHPANLTPAGRRMLGGLGEVEP